MAKLNLQKRLAADILKVGESKVWLDPNRQDEIKSAITRADIKNLIKKGWIKAKPGKVKRPREKRKRRKGPGSRKGSKYAKPTKKRRWIKTIRPLRRMLKELKESGKIDSATYRRLYRLVKGGQFRNRRHLRIYLEQRGILKEE